MEAVDITADLAGGYEPPGRSRRRRRRRPRRLRVSRAPLRRRDRVLAAGVTAMLAASAVGAVTFPPPPTAEQLLQRALTPGVVGAGLTFASSITEGADTLTASGSADLSHEQLQQTIDADGGRTDEVVTPTTIYVRLGGAPTPWLAVDARGLGGELLGDLGVSIALAGPTPLLQSLPDLTGARRAGRDAGRHCTHILGRLDGGAAARSAGLASTASSRVDGLSISSSVDACLADDGRPVRVTARVAVLAPASDAVSARTAMVTVAVTGVREQVMVRIPPDDEVRRDR